ncbi:MAG: RHS repeat-associated core domain-containing protein, partial [Candidatus Kerfeldbacteria bacterium]|nr:RHS repeat-associated core domain-containing protein [Candidatus Kerfeldbacteria bacterium]
QQGNLLKIRNTPGPRTSDQSFWETLYTYEPIFNQVRTVTANRGNDTGFIPPIADSGSNVRTIDFNLDGDSNDPADGETTRRLRYTTLQVFDYQERSPSGIATLAAAEGVVVTGPQATALSLNSDVNGDGVRGYSKGNVIEERKPNVTLEDGSAQAVITTYTYNSYGQLLSKADPEGGLETTSYFPASDPNGDGLSTEFPGNVVPLGADVSTGGYKQSVVRDQDPVLVSPVVTVSANLPAGRAYLPCAHNSAADTIYCFGGYNGSATNQIVEYHAATDTLAVSSATVPGGGRWGIACAENSATHKIYCFGGRNPTLSNQIFEFTPPSAAVAKSATLPSARDNMACAENSATHKIYCFGGSDPALNQVLEYDPLTDTLTTKTATLPTARYLFSCAENSSTHKIYCFGGADGSTYYNQIIEYDPATDALAVKSATLPNPEAGLSCAENSSTHKIKCVGGHTGSVFVASIVEYNPATNSLSTSSSLVPTGRLTLGCAEYVANHAIYCFGGEQAGGNFSSQILAVNPSGMVNSGTSRRTRNAAYVKTRETYSYDRVGNVTSKTDGRGVTTTFEINQLNQLVRETRGVVGVSFNQNGEEPNAPIPSLSYERVLYYDANDNLVQEDVENNDGDNASVAANPGLTTTKEYDILDKLVAQTQEVSNGEVGAAENITTSFRYDKNTNLVLTISPVAMLSSGSPERQANNVSATVFDERDLPFKESRGGIDSVFSGLAASGKAHENIDISQFSTAATTSTVTRSYDGNQNLLKLVDAQDNGQVNSEGGDVTSFTYDGADRVVLTIDPMGSETERHYDPQGNPVQRLNFGPIGSNIHGVPGDRNVNKRLAETKVDYDELSRAFRNQTAYFRTPGPTNDSQVPEYLSHTLFDRNGQITRLTEPDGNISTSEYDGLDRIVRSLDQLLPKSGGGNVQNETLTTYDDNSNVLKSVTIERSPTTAADETFASVTLYDAVNRPIRQTNNFGNTTRTKYDSRNNPVFTSDARGAAVTDPISNVAYRFPYSSSPGGVTQINADGNTTNLTYDGLNRVVKTVRDLRVGGIGSGAIDTSNTHNPDGQIQIDVDYDPNSRVVSRTDDADPIDVTQRSITSYSYDDLNRLITEKFSDNTQYQYVYDKDDHVTQATDPNGSIRTSTVSTGYDDLGRKIREDVTRAAGVEGTTIRLYEYDGLSRLTFSNDQDPSPENDDALVTSSFDSASRLTTQVQNLNTGTARTVTNEFSQDNRPIQLTYPNGRQITRGFDGLDRVTLVEEGAGTGTGNLIVPDANPANDIAGFDYIGPSRLLGQNYASPNSVSLGLTYDGARRPTRLNFTRSGSPVVDLRYAYNRSSEKLYEQFYHEGDQQADVFAYDSTSRLTQASLHVLGSSGEFTGISNNQLNNPSISSFSERQKSWTLDGAQNWRQVDEQTPTLPTAARRPTKKSLWSRLKNSIIPVQTTSSASTAYTPNQLNEYISVGGTARVYDANGNLKDDGTRTYVYDAYNRLVKVIDKSNTALLARYRYDTQNRRVLRDVQGLNGLTEYVHYIYDGWNVIEERNGSDNLVAQYVDGPMPDQHLQMKRDLNANSSFDSNETFFYHQNPLESVEAVTDANGAIAERHDYDVYGSDSVSVTTTNGNPYRYTGQRFDPESGLLYYKNRYYEPGTGRFLQRDPEGIWQDGVNFGNGYAYVGNNAVNFVDPTGLEERQQWTEESKKEALRKAIEYEKKHGTEALVKKYNPTTGEDAMLLRNLNAKTSAGEVDIDWALTLASYNQKTGISPWILYHTGKLYWSFTDDAFEEGYWERIKGHLGAYRCADECAAIDMATGLANGRSFASYFPELAEDGKKDKKAAPSPPKKPPPPSRRSYRVGEDRRGRDDRRDNRTSRTDSRPSGSTKQTTPRPYTVGP